MCDITCERDTICQSYSDVTGEKSCELNTRTKEARPENFQPDVYAFAWDAFVVEVCMWSSSFYIQIFLSEYFSKKPSTIREQVSDCFVIK